MIRAFTEGLSTHLKNLWILNQICVCVIALNTAYNKLKGEKNMQYVFFSYISWIA